MEYLMIVWKNYFEPTLNVTCNICYERVLVNWRSLQDALLEVHHEETMLDGN